LNAPVLSNEITIVFIESEILKSLAPILLQLGGRSVNSHGMKNGGNASDSANGNAVIVIPGLDP
jgi:hypothetical protein